MVKSLTELGGTTRPLLRFPDPEDKTWSAFNPSIGWAENQGYGMMIRSSNYLVSETTGWVTTNDHRPIRNRMWFAEVNQDSELSNLREVSFDHGPLIVERGSEDPRLFSRNGDWYFSAVMLEEHTVKARIAEYQFDPATSTATFLRKLEGPDPQRVEKNWAATNTPNSNFDYVYSPTQVFKDGDVLTVADFNPETKGIRGGSTLMPQEDGTYLAVVHTTAVTHGVRFNSRTFGRSRTTHRDYQHLFARYSPQGALIELSDPFIFNHRGIEYASGMVERGRDLLISYGYEDRSAHLATISKSIATGLLKPL